MNTGELEFVELIGIILSVVGAFAGLVSLIFGYTIFVSTQKNYYEKFLKFLRIKEIKIKRIANKSGISNPEFVSYLMKDLQFFGEDFFVDFSSDGYLKYHQFRTIKLIYRHLKKRLIISQKVFLKGVKNGEENIIIRTQIFGKFNNLNKKYFNSKLINEKLSEENLNVYVTVNFKYDLLKKKLINLSEDKPSSLFEMGDDSDFKKSIYFIFSSRNQIEEDLDKQDEWEKQYFFIGASYRNKNQNSEKSLENRENILEKEHKE
ncbi:hypothetical protein STIUS_v1c04160 [Spiroplasma sp. TIUS-1]|uniref:hypothetical protein n=1 Tax=Spiroplasma sp. TIUS-1 TaxID=216963 RepID=UPI0013983B50|nr:hypothetical protein [Spiroplasma sp. TIUS-1]QHX35970.1 hypothetical protein STIUS_v1c04160 [Spiroplasma sp. TIUS-1]